MSRNRKKSTHSLGWTLRDLRDKNDMSQVALAAASEVSQGYLSQLEHDEVPNPSVVVLLKIAAGLSIDPKVIMEAAGYENFLEPQGEKIHFRIDPDLAAFIGKLTSRIQLELLYLLASLSGKPLTATIETELNIHADTKNPAVETRRKHKLGDMIRTLREDIPLSQEGLSTDAVLSQSYLSQLESGAKKNPSAITILRIAKALKVDAEELFEAAGYLTAKHQQELYQTNEERIQPDLVTFLSELSKPQQRRLLLLLRAIESLLSSKEAVKNLALIR